MMEQNENKNSEKQQLQNINVKSFLPFFTFHMIKY